MKSKRADMDEEPSKDKKKGQESESSKALSELEKYWQVVRDNPSDFAGWTYLLHHVEQEHNIEAAREAFTSFFKHYPYCYGYWKKYADMEKTLNDADAAEKVFEEGVRAIPLSVDLWTHYINFYKFKQSGKEDYYSKVKELFNRALSAAGKEFRSDRLWDLYVTWEEENNNPKGVTKAYDLLLTIPTQLYSHHFEKFQKHVKKNSPREMLSTDEFLELRQGVVTSSKGVDDDDLEDEDEDKSASKVAADESVPPGVDDDAPPGLEPPSKVDKDMMSEEEIELMRKKIIENRKVLFNANEIEVGKRWMFEEGIKRPYFHVKALERAQLRNWKEYLDFEIQNGTHERVIILFERCLIACALYEDMWLKYARYMEEHDINLARNVYERACKIHLPKKANIHFSWAAYEEKRGNVKEAEDILCELEKNIPDMLEIILRKINLKRRQGDHEKVEEMYTQCISEAKTSLMSSHFAAKYSRYLYKVRGDFSRASEVLKEALLRDPTNPNLIMQLVDISYQKAPVDIQAVQEAFDMALSGEMNIDQKLRFAQRKLEFLEDFSADPQSIQVAFEEYSRTLKSHIISRKRAAEESEESSKEKRVKTEVNGTTAAVAATTTTATNTTTPTTQASTGAAASQDSSYQYHQSPWVGYPQNSYNYQQSWAAHYPASYYSSH